MNADDYKIEIKLNLGEILKDVTENEYSFPKYTTQIINLANQNVQGTRPKVVGQMSELIHEIPEKTFKTWMSWYLENYPEKN
jgi:hypothetical protein